MFIISEYVACVFAVWVGMTLLFMASVMFLAFQEGFSRVVRMLPEFVYPSFLYPGRRRVAVGSRVP